MYPPIQFPRTILFFLPNQWNGSESLRPPDQPQRRRKKALCDQAGDIAYRQLLMMRTPNSWKRITLHNFSWRPLQLNDNSWHLLVIIEVKNLVQLCLKVSWGTLYVYVGRLLEEKCCVLFAEFVFEMSLRGCLKLFLGDDRILGTNLGMPEYQAGVIVSPFRMGCQTKQGVSPVKSLTQLLTTMDMPFFMI